MRLYYVYSPSPFMVQKGPPHKAQDSSNLRGAEGGGSCWGGKLVLQDVQHPHSTINPTNTQNDTGQQVMVTSETGSMMSLVCL